MAREQKTTNNVVLHHFAYRPIKARFGMVANLVVRAMARACTALKANPQDQPVFEPTSIDYDARIFAFREKDWTFSLSLLTSRERIATNLGDYQRNALRGQKPTSATLVKKEDGYYLHVQIKEDLPEPPSARDHLGVDLGIAQIATDSDGVAHSGKQVEKIRRKHNLQRKRLGRRNTKGAKKKLKRIAGKEKRFRRHVDHVISKRLVQTAKRTGRGIALENLKGIRFRVRARGAEARSRLSGWSFHQLGTFIQYKALREGVPVVFVNPRHTSQTCSQCKHCERGNRRSQADFHCKQCGFSCNADWNAANNVSFLAQGTVGYP